MTTLRVLNADDADLADRRLAAAMQRYGFPNRFGSLANDLRAGTGLVVIADVNDDDPDADIVVYFHREPADPATVVWVQQLWSRSIKVVRVFEAACVRMLARGITTARFGKSSLPYTVQAAQLTNATDKGDYWEVDVQTALTRIRSYINQRGIPPL